MPVETLSRTNDPQVEQLLAAARRAIDEVPYCWVVTAAGDGDAHARAVKAFPNDKGEDLWTRWFLTNRIGRKATEIRQSGQVTLAYQHQSGEAYVALAGRAEIIDEPDAVESRLKEVYDPDGRLAGTLVAVRVTGERLELHLRGVTAEPRGHAHTWLDRMPDGSWRLVEWAGALRTEQHSGAEDMAIRGLHEDGDALPRLGRLDRERQFRAVPFAER